MKTVNLTRNAISKYSTSYLEDAEKVLPRLYPSTSYEVFGAEDITNSKRSTEENYLLIEPRLFVLLIFYQRAKVQKVFRTDPSTGQILQVLYRS